MSWLSEWFPSPSLCRPLIITSWIFPEDEHLNTVCDAIISAWKEKRDLLDPWIVVHKAEFGSDHDISSENAVHLSKLNFSVINTDTCNSAFLLSMMLLEKVEDAVWEKIMQNCGIPNNENIRVLIQNCHHHLLNVWKGAVVKKLSTYLDEFLASYLIAIDFRLRVCTLFNAVLQSLDKKFSLPGNYPKGHGLWFKHWLKRNHPNLLLVPVQRTAGSRQDLECKGAAAVY